MCGIAGFLTLIKTDNPFAIATRMADAIVHRGPDDAGAWVDEAAGVALAHRRLAILDLTPAGAQPMISACGRYVMVFNGEVYNFEEIRIELEKAGAAPAWRGHSDTEVMLVAIATWGLEAALKKFVGMFAFALWDRENRTLTLARDRLGEKPLYYGRQGGVFLFGSELKALKQHPAFEGEVDREALALYLRYCTIPAPRSIYRGIHKLTPGTLLRVCASDRQLSEPMPFWLLNDVAEQGQREFFQGSDAEAVAALEAKLLDAVRLQQIADVPLGAFLSGGIDSSTIVALMQAQSTRPVRTFTIGFQEAGYNEAEHAKAIARHLGTDHTELYVTPAQAQAVIPRLATLYDEPFADSSQIPTYLVSQMARERVTVSLSGDGGDELFGGYNRYAWATKILQRPRFLRKLLAHGLTALSPLVLNRLCRALAPVVPKSMRFGLPGDKAHKLASILGAESQVAIYRGLVSTWPAPADVVLGSEEPATLLDDPSRWADVSEFEHRMMYLDAMSYLPDDTLVKVDRAAMGVSLETRVPFLDHRVVEFAWQLPLSMKIRDGQGKWILRQVLYKYVPRNLIERPKTGFGVPIDSWLRGPLREWAEDLLDESRLRREGFFNSAPIRQKWTEHLSGQRNWQYHLWGILMFQEWLDGITHSKHNGD